MLNTARGRTAVRSAAVDLDIVFLGTAGSAPTARRSASATLLRHGGDRVLVDCGEGTQRQLLRSDVGLVDLEDVFLTHLHADHFLGLPGMLKTFSLRGRDVPLTVYGPAGTRSLLDGLRRIFGRLTVRAPRGRARARRGDRARGLSPRGHRGGPRGHRRRLRPARGRASRPLRRRRLPIGSACRPAPHGERCSAEKRSPSRTARPSARMPCSALPRAGRTIVLTGDTAPCASVVEAATGADVLVHDATFLADDRARAKRDRSLDRRGGRARRARGRSPAPGADAPLRPLRATRRRARGGRAVPLERRPARLRRHPPAVPRARRARARDRGARSRPDPGVPSET